MEYIIRGLTVVVLVVIVLLTTSIEAKIEKMEKRIIELQSQVK